MKVHYPLSHNMALLALNVLLLSKDLTIILLAITAAGVVPCGGPKQSPRTSPIVQILFCVDHLRSVKTIGVFQINFTSK